MYTSRVAHADARAGRRGASAWRKIVISYPKRRAAPPASGACSTPVKYHHSLRNPGCGPSSSGKTNGRGASARSKPSSGPCPAASDSSAGSDSRPAAGGAGTAAGREEPPPHAARRAPTTRAMPSRFIRRAAPPRVRCAPARQAGNSPDTTPAAAPSSGAVASVRASNRIGMVHPNERWLITNTSTAASSAPSGTASAPASAPSTPVSRSAISATWAARGAQRAQRRQLAPALERDRHQRAGHAEAGDDQREDPQHARDLERAIEDAQAHLAQRLVGPHQHHIVGVEARAHLGDQLVRGNAGRAVERNRGHQPIVEVALVGAAAEHHRPRVAAVVAIDPGDAKRMRPRSVGSTTLSPMRARRL